MPTLAAILNQHKRKLNQCQKQLRQSTNQLVNPHRSVSDVIDKLKTSTSVYDIPDITVSDYDVDRTNEHERIATLKKRVSNTKLKIDKHVAIDEQPTMIKNPIISKAKYKKST